MLRPPVLGGVSHQGFSPPVQDWTLLWLGSHLGFWFALLPQLYGRHKEYLSSLVGTDFETVSPWLPAAPWLGSARAL